MFKRTLYLFFGILVSISSGSVSIYPIYSYYIKNLYGFSLRQINLYGTFINIGCWIAFAMGIIYDYCGPKISNFLGFIFLPICLLILYRIIELYSSISLFWLLFLGFIMGQGSALLYTSALTTNIKNFSKKNSSNIVGLIASNCAISPSIFASFKQAFDTMDIPDFLSFVFVYTSIIIILSFCLFDIVKDNKNYEFNEKIFRENKQLFMIGLFSSVNFFAVCLFIITLNINNIFGIQLPAFIIFPVVHLILLVFVIMEKCNQFDGLLEERFNRNHGNFYQNTFTTYNFDTVKDVPIEEKKENDLENNINNINNKDNLNKNNKNENDKKNDRIYSENENFGKLRKNPDFDINDKDNINNKENSEDIHVSKNLFIDEFFNGNNNNGNNNGNNNNGYNNGNNNRNSQANNNINNIGEYNNNDEGRISNNVENDEENGINNLNINENLKENNDDDNNNEDKNINNGKESTINNNNYESSSNLSDDENDNNNDNNKKQENKNDKSEEENKENENEKSNFDNNDNLNNNNKTNNDIDDNSENNEKNNKENKENKKIKEENEEEKNEEEKKEEDNEERKEDKNEEKSGENNEEENEEDNEQMNKNKKENENENEQQNNNNNRISYPSFNDGNDYNNENNNNPEINNNNDINNYPKFSLNSEKNGNEENNNDNNNNNYPKFSITNENNNNEDNNEQNNNIFNNNDINNINSDKNNQNNNELENKQNNNTVYKRNRDINSSKSNYFDSEKKQILSPNEYNNATQNNLIITYSSPFNLRNSVEDEEDDAEENHNKFVLLLSLFCKPQIMQFFFVLILTMGSMISNVNNIKFIASSISSDHSLDSNKLDRFPLIYFSFNSLSRILTGASISAVMGTEYTFAALQTITFIGLLSQLWGIFMTKFTLYISISLAGITHGSLMTFVPLYCRYYYNVNDLGTVFGFLTTGNAFGSLIIATLIFPHFYHKYSKYDKKIGEYCSGKKCFQKSYLINSLFMLIALLISYLIFKSDKRKKIKERQDREKMYRTVALCSDNPRVSVGSQNSNQ